MGDGRSSKTIIIEQESMPETLIYTEKLSLEIKKLRFLSKAFDMSTLQ